MDKYFITFIIIIIVIIILYIIILLFAQKNWTKYMNNRQYLYD
jgi:uncharacterized alpha/beta hydrolase family protein